MLLLLLACRPGATGPDSQVPDDTADTQDTSVDCPVRYADLDQDGFGDASTGTETCDETWVSDATDCDDTDPDVFPGAAELCDEVDQDCDNAVDEDLDPGPWYLDGDGDGVGAGDPLDGCQQDGWVSDGCDCDDADDSVASDPFTCPPVECREGDQVLRRLSCGVEAASLPIDQDGAYTVCPGTYTQVSVEAATVHLLGADGVIFNGVPALQVQDDAQVLVSGVTLSGSGTSSGSAWLVRAGGADVTFVDSTLQGGGSSKSNALAIQTRDLTLTDSVIQSFSAGVNSSYSNLCSYTWVSVAGDLAMTRSDVLNTSMSCGSWSHSAWGQGVFRGITVAGDATLDDVTLSGHSMEAGSSGVAQDMDAVLLDVGGDLDATDVAVEDNTLLLYQQCQRTLCYVTLAGASVSVSGSASWTGGALLGGPATDLNPLGSTTTFSEFIDAWPLRWLGGEGDTLSVTEVDFGSDSSDDVGGQVDWDPDGVSSFTCTTAGCSE